MITCDRCKFSEPSNKNPTIIRHVEVLTMQMNITRDTKEVVVQPLEKMVSADLCEICSELAESRFKTNWQIFLDEGKK